MWREDLCSPRSEVHAIIKSFSFHARMKQPLNQIRFIFQKPKLENQFRLALTVTSLALVYNTQGI